MSWFFGKKKHRDSPPSSPDEPNPPDEGFIFVERRNQADPNSEDKSPSLYPSLNLNDITIPYPPVPTPLTKQSSLEGPSNYISYIPFKLSRELQRTLNDDLEIDRLRLEEIASFIQKINVDDYNYEFSVEQSVINEMNSQNEL